VGLAGPGSGDGSGGGFDGLDGDGEPEEDWPEWVIRDYYDPELGENISIIDGRVIICMTDPPQHLELDPNYFDDEGVVTYPPEVYPEYPDALDDPRVVQFLAETGATPYSEWLSIRAFGIFLPPDVSVEYAVENWPSQYSEWMEFCEPDCLLEMDTYLNDHYAYTPRWQSWHLWGPAQGSAYRYGMRFYDAWENGNKGVSAYFRIAVADTGVDREYAVPIYGIWRDFRSRLTVDGAKVGDWSGSTQFGTGTGEGWAWVRNRKASWAKEWGHGTLVTGGIAGRVNNDPNSQLGDYNDVAGATWYNKVFPIAMKHHGGFNTSAENCMYEVLGAVKRVYNPYQVWRKYPQIASMCPRYNLEIANFSFGGKKLRYSTRRHLNILSRYILMIASAGNHGTTQMRYPAGHSRVLAIGAYLWNGYRVNYSAYGSWLFAAAPAHYYSTDAIGTSPNGYTYGNVNYFHETCIFTGTSAAAPLVTGAAALVQSKYRYWTPLQVKSRLRASINLLPDSSLPGFIDVVMATQ
ncbi:S8/S53 family peptidase, partial [bacterium]|nr:S8/S53 family peptidase [bacterium]